MTGKEDSIMWPLHETAFDEITLWKKKFKCVKPEDYKIWGEYNSNKARQLMISFEKCHGHDYCKSNVEIL